MFASRAARGASLHSQSIHRLSTGSRIMSLVKEFKEFAIKGNVVDIAVGVVIGAAFGKIVSSLVSDVITPPLGYIIGGVDFTRLSQVLPPLLAGQTPVTIRYGVFLQAVFDFIVVAF